MNSESGNNKILVVTIFDSHCVSWEEIDRNASIKDFKDMLVNKYVISDNMVFEIRDNVLPIKKNIMLKDMDRRKHNCIEIHVFTHERITKLVERE